MQLIYVNMKLNPTFCKRIYVATFSCMLLMLSSCNGDNESPCGCSSDETELIADNYASIFMYDDKPVLISLEKGFLTLCDTTLEFSNGTILKDLGGKVKSKCMVLLDTVIRFEQTYSYKSQFFELTKSNGLNESLVNKPITWRHFKITIIKSEDYGYPEGFGCLITNQNTETNINIAILPVQGFVPCKSELDAAKVAFYYVHKMYKFSDDLVGMDEWELQFIGVLD